MYRKLSIASVSWSSSTAAAVLLELVVRLAHKYGLGEKNVRCL